MTHKVKVAEEQRSPKGKEPNFAKKPEVQRAPKAESPKGQSALKGIVPNRKNSTESLTVLSKGTHFWQEGHKFENNNKNNTT